MGEWKQVATTAERIQQVLDEQGKKQTDLSAASGIDKGAISRYLSGKVEPKQKAIMAIAQALDVSEMWLWGYDVPKERQKEKPTVYGELSPKKWEFIERVKQMSDTELDRLDQILRIVENTK